MGTEAIWVPLVLAAVGTAASVYNTRQTAKKQDNALAQQINNQAKKGKEGDARAKALIDATAQSNPENAKATALGQYVQQLKAGNGVATAGLTGGAGAASSRYTTDAADAALGVGQYGTEQAGLASRIDAPKRQRDQEAFDRARAGNDLGLIERSARMRDFLDNLKVQGVRRSAGLDAFAGLANGAAGAYGGGGASAGAGAGAGGDIGDWATIFT